MPSVAATASGHLRAGTPNRHRAATCPGAPPAACRSDNAAPRNRVRLPGARRARRAIRPTRAALRSSCVPNARNAGAPRTAVGLEFRVQRWRKPTLRREAVHAAGRDRTNDTHGTLLTREARVATETSQPPHEPSAATWIALPPRRGPDAGNGCSLLYKGVICDGTPWSRAVQRAARRFAR